MNLNLKPLKMAALMLPFLFGPVVYCQWQNGLWTQKQANNWYYGRHHGLTFSSGSPQAVPNGQTNVSEGSACMSDGQGGLLFYAAGGTVWNKEHEVMLNGESLLAGSQSSTQSGVIVPKPGSEGIYYLFNVDITDGLVYSEIDMALDNGRGGITANKNIILDPDARVEKITAVYHQDKQDIWVISHRKAGNEFIAYLISTEGVAAAVTSAVGTSYTTAVPVEGPYIFDGPGGHLKASPDGTRLAAVHDMNGMVELFDFNALTGQVSNAIQINVVNDSYGLEFSPNGRFLYVPDHIFMPTAGPLGTTTVKVFQFDLFAGDANAIQGSAVIVGEYFSRYESAVQLGPDGRIYAENSKSLNSLVAIANPNNKGLACGFQLNALTMTDEDFIGMPNFNQSYFESGILYEQHCGEAVFSLLRIPDVSGVVWNFGDPASGEDNTSVTGVHNFSAPGTYTVTAEISSNGAVQTATTIISVDFATYGQPEDLSACSAGEGTAAFDLTSQNATILEGLDASGFAIGYYTDADGAANGSNGIADTENFISAGQTIYAGVTDTVTGCKSVLEFELKVLKAPLLPVGLELRDCVIYNLNEAFTDIENAAISFYATNDEALAGNNPVSFPERYEPAPGNDIVYVRAENDNGCTAFTTLKLVKGHCDIQKGISPNNDAYNEYFDLADFDIENLTIFNRYGGKVYEKLNYSNQWHGQDNEGNLLPTGTYFYMVRLRDGSRTGWIYINR